MDPIQDILRFIKILTSFCRTCTTYLCLLVTVWHTYSYVAAGFMASCAHYLQTFLALRQQFTIEAQVVGFPLLHRLGWNLTDSNSVQGQIQKGEPNCHPEVTPSETFGDVWAKWRILVLGVRVIKRHEFAQVPRPSEACPKIPVNWCDLLVRITGWSTSLIRFRV